jgi:hypothetical protein
MELNHPSTPAEDTSVVTLVGMMIFFAMPTPGILHTLDNIFQSKNFLYLSVGNNKGFFFGI